MSLPKENSSAYVNDELSKLTILLNFFLISINKNDSLSLICLIFSIPLVKCLKIIFSTIRLHEFKTNCKFFKSFLGSKKKLNDDCKTLHEVL